MPEFKLPVHIETYTMLFGEDVLEHKGLVDADGLEVDLQDVADALNATATTPAPDLTALRKAVEAWRFVCDRYDRELEGYGMVQSAEHDVIIAADILFQKDGTP